MISFMGENKRLLNIHEQKFAELATFQENTTMFQANTNVSLNNLETQLGQLALEMQNRSKDVFLSNTKKNPKDWMSVTLRSGKGLEESINEKKKIEEEKHTKIEEETKQYNLEITKEERTMKVQ